MSTESSAQIGHHSGVEEGEGAADERQGETVRAAPLDEELSRLLAVRHCAEIAMKGEQKRTNEQQLMP